MVTLETSDPQFSTRSARSPRPVGIELSRRKATASGLTGRLFGRLRSLSNTEISTAAQWADSVRARELLAARATSHRFGYVELVRSAHRAVAGELPRSLAPTRAESRAIVALAELVLHQASVEAEFADAAALYCLVHSTRGGRALSDREQQHYASALIASGQHAVADRLVATWQEPIDAERLQVHADRQNPHHRTDLIPSRDLWPHAFNDVFASVGLEPPRHDSDAVVEHAFDRLVSPAVVPVEGPLVTVIMSCYRPGPEIRTAVASILAQSWRNLELLIMDDGSPEEYGALLAELAGLDERIRLVHRDINQGTYACRNAALQLARGEFVTMHDSDDWAHPRRLEAQAQYLLETPDAPSCSTFALRVTDSLLLFQPRGRDVKLCEPSLMFRRERVLDRIGYFDAVTKGADSEFRKRIRAAFERESDLVRPGEPLTLQRYRQASLTGEEIRPRWMHESRIAYGSAARVWHSAIIDDGVSPYLAAGQSPRPFPAPAEIIRSAHAPEVVQLDVVFALDLVARERDRRDFRALEQHIRSLAARGQRVGLANLWSIGPKPLGPVHHVSRLQELIADGIAVQVLTGTAVVVDRVVLPDPSVLQFASPTPVPWQLRTVEAELRVPHALRHRAQLPFDAQSCAETARDIFGVQLEWKRGCSTAS